MIRKVLTVAAAVALASALAFCGGKTTTPGADAGHKFPDVFYPDCITSFDCPEGDCVEGRCVTCTADSCGDLVCTVEGKCVGRDAGAPPATCTKRDECPAGKICKITVTGDASVGRCQDPTGNCLTPEECPSGQVCDFTHNVCIVGCFSNDDCKTAVTPDGGLPAPHCDKGITYQCTPCVEGTDCNAGEICKDQLCQKAPQCVPPDRTPCNDLVCVTLDGGGYACGPCQPMDGGSPCGPGYVCTAGKCAVQPPTCTDEGCQAMHAPGFYCDSNGECQWGCLPYVTPDGGTCGKSCCSADAGEECNTTTHQCGGAVTCEDCNPPCMGMDEQCDLATCTCVSIYVGDGGVNDGGGIYTCDPDKCTGCPTGMKCKCGEPQMGGYACTSFYTCSQAPVVVQAYCQ
jgi:hypothetical protein